MPSHFTTQIVQIPINHKVSKSPDSTGQSPMKFEQPTLRRAPPVRRALLARGHRLGQVDPLAESKRCYFSSIRKNHRLEAVSRVH